MTSNLQKSSSSSAKRIARRSRSRGAALVEAALVLPVMVSFLGLTMFVHRSYADKIDMQATTRSEILYYGSHNCEGNPPAEISKQGDVANPTPGADGNTQAMGGKAGVTGGLDRNWQLAKSSRSGQTQAQKVVLWKQSYMLSRPIHADSEVACNEKRYDNTWTAVFQFIGGFARSGGGFL